MPIFKTAVFLGTSGNAGLKSGMFFSREALSLDRSSSVFSEPSVRTPVFNLWNEHLGIARSQREEALTPRCPAWESLPSPSPLCEFTLKFFIQAYFLCVLSVFSVFSVRARSFALNPGILSLCPLCEPLFLIFGTNTWVSRRRKKKKRLRRDAAAWECLPSPSPLCKLALKFFIQAYFLCVLSVFSVFSVRARSFALNQAFFLCALCANLFWFLKNMLRGSAAPLREEALTPR